jgi:hypothetical protein
MVRLLVDMDVEGNHEAGPPSSSLSSIPSSSLSPPSSSSTHQDQTAEAATCGRNNMNPINMNPFTAALSCYP